MAEGLSHAPETSSSGITLDGLSAIAGALKEGDITPEKRRLLYEELLDLLPKLERVAVSVKTALRENGGWVSRR